MHLYCVFVHFPYGCQYFWNGLQRTRFSFTDHHPDGLGIIHKADLVLINVSLNAQVEPKLSSWSRELIFEAFSIFHSSLTSGPRALPRLIQCRHALASDGVCLKNSCQLTAAEQIKCAAPSHGGTKKKKNHKPHTFVEKSLVLQFTVDLSSAL